MLGFSVNGTPYVVAASEFVNAWVHDDRGVFVVRRPGDPLDEAEVIARLIDVAGRSGGVMIAPPEAAQRPEVFAGTVGDGEQPRRADDYLRDVWWFGRRKIRTAADLARAADRHPAAAGSGRAEPVPLRIRFPDGTERPAGEWLDAELTWIVDGLAAAAARPARPTR
jgi:hypothetical protein